MANEIINTENIAVEFAEQNVVLIDPNRIVVEGEIQERLVKHEELTIYVNLQARVVPRSKVIAGAGLETEALVDIFEGNINFMKPGGKDYLTTDWVDSATGEHNSKQYRDTQDPVTGKDINREIITNKRDSEAFGITNIQISLNPSYVPTVTINFVDVKGRTLFEQGQNSPYAAFFQMPYPLFFLTVKGFYGKAVKYQLMMHKFNASFDPQSGNYNVVCNFIGRTTAMLSDLTVQEIMNAPYMYPRQYQKSTKDSEEFQLITTSRGAQVQHEVYNIYRAKGLIAEDFPDMSIKELVDRVSNLDTLIEQALEPYNLSALDDIDNYEKLLSNFSFKILGEAGWSRRYLNFTDISIYVDSSTQRVYYTWRKEVGENEEKKQEAIDALKKALKEYGDELLKNPTFGTNGDEFIPVDIKYLDFVAENVAGMPEGTDEWYVLNGDNTTFEEKLNVIRTQFEKKKTKIETRLTNIINSTVSSSVGIGFKPTIRNLYAVILSGADTFLRLMNETHLEAMGKRDNSNRLNALKGSGAPDKQLEKDEFVFPWPAYYMREDNEHGGQTFVTTYPGASKALTQTKSYIPGTWPEVEFVEEYLRATVIRDRFPQISGQNNALGERWLPVTSADFKLKGIYADTAYIPFYYELWDRSLFHTYYSGMKSRLMSDKADTTLQAMATIEVANMKVMSEGAFDLQEQLKNQTLNFNSFSTQGDGGGASFLQQMAPRSKWQLLIRDEIITQNIKDMVDGPRFVIYPYVDLITTNHENENTPTGEATKTIKEFLSIAKVDNGKILFDTYPFIDFNHSNSPWVKKYLANGKQIGSFQQLYGISNNLTVSENIKAYTSNIKPEGDLAGFGSAIFYSDPKCLVPTYRKLYEDVVTKRFNISGNKIGWKNFFNGVTGELSATLSNNDLFLTESEISYLDGDSGIVPGGKQIVSMLNTPYFTNAFREGVLNDMSGSQNPYIAASYLLVNSLPLGTLRDKGVVDVKGGVTEHGDYIFSTLNQVSALHPLPYSWILKYGSIWHRYKTYITTGVDILTNSWKNYDAAQGFNPSTNSLNHLYNLDIGSNNNTISIGAEINSGGHTVVNLGFYPELINMTHWFVTDTLLYENTTITGLPVTDAGINGFIMAGALNVKNNEDIHINDAESDTEVNFWNVYYDTIHDTLTSGMTPTYILYPSSGGMKESQLQFDVKDGLANNPATHNGNSRFLWSTSQYGYFKHNIGTLPKPWQYMTKTDNSNDMQKPFVLDSGSNYDSIEELFDIFSPNTLDKFEEYFLNFSQNETKYNSGLDGLEYFTEEGGTITGLTNTNEMTFQSVVRGLLKLPKSVVEFSDTDSIFGINLAKAQNKKINDTLNRFLRKRVTFKFHNQNDINKRALRTFIGDAKYYDFGSYQNNLPPEVTLTTSKANLTQEWVTLQKNIGFFSEVGSHTLYYDDLGSEVTDFFKEMDINFTSGNIVALRKVIRMYVTERIRNGSTQSSTMAPNPSPSGFKDYFISKVKEVLDNLEDGQSTHVNEIFFQSKEIFDSVPKRAEIDDVDPAFQTDIQKLELYQTFKTLNDKWVSGEEFGQKTLFEDFLFFDRANRDIGDLAILDVNPLKSLNAPENASFSLYGLLGSMLQGNNFHFLALPSYINFYGVTQVSAVEIDNFTTSNEANDLFGTHLQVDYQDSSPKFLCMYVGEPSQHTEVQSDIYKYDSDSFFLGRTAGNPLFSNCTDPTKCNKVVAFNVDFGNLSQGIFKGLNLDQNEYRNTAETFFVVENMANSANDKSIATQGLNLFNVYRSRSYTCKVEAMGNACIQPTMYFNLRHVPMFNGPYLITDVEHSITANDMKTSFTGIRSPFFDLPNIEDIVARVNKSFITRLKTKTTKTTTVADVEDSADYGPPLKPSVGDEKTRVKRAMTILIDKGASTYGAAAVVGNMLSESRLIVDRLETSWLNKNESYKGGIGLVQWTGSRRTKFEKHFGIANSVEERKELIGPNNERVLEYQILVQDKVSFEDAVLYYWDEIGATVRNKLKIANNAGEASEAILADLRPGAYLCWSLWESKGETKYCGKGQKTYEAALNKKNETRDKRARNTMKAYNTYKS
jgi:hypothetical protein|tara:strand:+ start:51263 stop:57487 length:6225 start_codon:yes stop_codon:yes gene_type:complete